MSEHTKYSSLVALFLDVMNGLAGTVVQAFDGQTHHYFVVKKYNQEAIQNSYPSMRSIVRLGVAKSGVFRAEINSKNADFDAREFAQHVIKCQNCDFVATVNFHSDVPGDRANEVWRALVEHQKVGCQNAIFNMMR